MRNITPPSWAIPESKVTPEHTFLNRRQWLAGAGALMGTIATSTSAHALAAAESPWSPAAPKNPAYADAGRPVTYEEDNTTYNNFYEFGSHKQIAPAAQALITDPWSITIDGMVEKPFQISIDDLVAQMPIEERIYRHRCVEAWSMVVPWIGFEVKRLVELANPLKVDFLPQVADRPRQRTWNCRLHQGRHDRQRRRGTLPHRPDDHETPCLTALISSPEAGLKGGAGLWL